MARPKSIEDRADRRLRQQQDGAADGYEGLAMVARQVPRSDFRGFFHGLIARDGIQGKASELNAVELELLQRLESGSSSLHSSNCDNFGDRFPEAIRNLIRNGSERLEKGVLRGF